MIPYGKHYIDTKDIESVKWLLKNSSLTQGPLINKFEKAIAKYVGSKFAVAVSSCTAGLHLSLLATGFKKSNLMVTSPITFVSSANAALYAGGKPLFSDVDEKTINLCPKKLEKKLINNKKIKFVMPVHFGGYPCNMKLISKICKKYNVKVIEDAAHALGANYENGSKVGCCKYSSTTVFSLHPVKTIAAGEGGVITTNNEKIYKKLLRLRSHGINKLNDKFQFKKNAYTKNRFNPWYYEMQELGFHYRITEIQCALAISQLKKINKFINKRKNLSKFYNSKFKNSKKIKPLYNFSNSGSSNHLYIIRINFEQLKISRAEIMHRLKSKGIGSQVHYIPIPDHPYYKKMGFNSSDYPNAQLYYKQALTIPLFYKLSKKQQNYIVQSIKEIIE
tara:strand:+ start:1592 stop:2764 length:1173 start_codon:yes stop_codon:yes gene_type:complete